jgi:O-antigen ligase
VLLTAICVGIIAALTVTKIATLSLGGGLLLVGAVAAATLAAVLVTNYEWFVVFVLLIRPSLDGLGGEESVTPSIVVGAIFLASALLWLLLQHAAGGLVRPSRLTVALLALAAALGVSTLGSADVAVSLSSAVRFLSGAIMFFVIEQVVHMRPRGARALMVAFFGSLVLPAVVAVSQQLSGDVYFSHFNGRVGVRGTFVHPNPFATYLVLAIVTAIALLPQTRGRARTGLLVFGIICTPLLVWTYTRIAWIALVVAVVYLALRQDRRLFIGLGAGLVTIPLLAPGVLDRLADVAGRTGLRDDPNSMAWRFQYWEKILPLGVGRPITGVGFGMVENLRPERLPPHNVFVQGFVEGGLLALTGLAIVAWAAWRDHQDRWRAAADPRARAFALAAGATGLTLITQLSSENLLSETATLWAMALILGVGRAAIERPWAVLGGDEIAPPVGYRGSHRHPTPPMTSGASATGPS